jgi:hypothetical protein
MVSNSNPDYIYTLCLLRLSVDRLSFCILLFSIFLQCLHSLIEFFQQIQLSLQAFSTQYSVFVRTMVSKALMGVWVALDILLLAACVLTLALSVVWRAPNILINMVLSSAALNGTILFLAQLLRAKKTTLAGFILGVALFITFVISIGAIVQRNHITIGLVLLNYALLVDAMGILVIATFIWFSTLQERAEFHDFWVGTSPATKIALQDMASSSPNVLSAYLKDSNSFSVVGISAGLI